MKSQNSIVFLVPGFPENEKDTTCIPALQLYVKHFNSVNQYLNIIVIAFQYTYKKKEGKGENIKGNYMDKSNYIFYKSKR